MLACSLSLDQSSRPSTRQYFGVSSGIFRSIEVGGTDVNRRIAEGVGITPS